MKYLITESSLDIIVKALLGSKKIMPVKNASEIIGMYLQSNPDITIENLIFEKLDNKNFVRINKVSNIYFAKVSNIYFANSEDDEYAQIRYDIDQRLCTIYNELIDEISSLFSLEKNDSKQVISSWVENTIKRKIHSFRGCSPGYQRLLKIPNMEIDFNE
jgi:hypothetical protein